ncbi:hypothetical protein [Actinacidiphila alni]|uniref:hypothetical protein n=1 Tax=Actinacidiphila alni TaxID=380248 RepID=UPI001160B82C|nr:hypothetical protein [Actinacidiphila alni]
MAAADPYRGDHLPLVGADIMQLPNLQLQKLALTRIAQLTSGEIQGRKLDELPSWPKALGECWKLYFGEHEHDIGHRLNRRPPAYRIVYRFLPPVDKPNDRDKRPRIQVLALGPRAQSEAYERAATRLARPEVHRERAIQPPSPASAGESIAPRNPRARTPVEQPQTPRRNPRRRLP